MKLTAHDKKLLLLPLLLLPLLAFLFSAMGGGKVSQPGYGNKGTGLDTSFPIGKTSIIPSSMEEIVQCHQFMRIVVI
jgi:hypothetical protein